MQRSFSFFGCLLLSPPSRFPPISLFLYPCFPFSAWPQNNLSRHKKGPLNCIALNSMTTQCHKQDRLSLSCSRKVQRGYLVMGVRDRFDRLSLSIFSIDGKVYLILIHN